jgi:hypothetical protein
VERLCTRGKYLGIKGNAHELFWGILTFLLGEFKSLKKELVNFSFLTGAIKKTNRGEREFKISGKKFKEKLGIFPGLNSSIISSISNFKMF